MNPSIALVIGIGIGVIIGVVAMLALRHVVTANGRDIIDTASKSFSDQAATTFKSLSMDALTPVTDQLANIATSKLAEQQNRAAQDIEGKKELIDQTLDKMNTQLAKVQTAMQDLREKEESQLGKLSQQLVDTSTQTNRLSEVTTNLKEALASTKKRGQWGERMAEDVLKVSGFVCGASYTKQKQETSGDFPDFTFPLPRNLRLNMDVKFPITNYMNMIAATTDTERDMHKKKFFVDVEDRVKEITSRGYINTADGTLDCVLLFIPNESVFTFVQECDPEFLDKALAQHVIVCSPSTLFAILAVIREATDSFAVEQNVGAIVKEFGKFDEQWTAFTKIYDKLSSHLRLAQEDFSEMSGVRTQKLDRILEGIHVLEEKEQSSAGTLAPENAAPAEGIPAQAQVHSPGMPD
ncbi:MAG: DNA recombination protein RmuC [Candidatus Cryosericum sp.]